MWCIPPRGGHNGRWGKGRPWASPHVSNILIGTFYFKQCTTLLPLPPPFFLDLCWSGTQKMTLANEYLDNQRWIREEGGWKITSHLHVQYVLPFLFRLIDSTYFDLDYLDYQKKFNPIIRLLNFTRSPSVGACKSHTKPISRHFYRLIYF